MAFHVIERLRQNSDLRQCSALPYPDGHGVVGWGPQVRQAGPTHRHPSHLFNRGSKPFLVGWKRGWCIFSNLPSWPLGFEFTLFFPAVKINALKLFISTEKTGRQIHKFPPQGYNNRSQFICQPLLWPQAKALFGENSRHHQPSPPQYTKYMSTKTLLSTGWQTPSQNCSGLARQSIPLQSHAPSQQGLFIHGQCPSKDVQNYFLALLEGLESSKIIACHTKIHSRFVSANSLDAYSLSQLPLRPKVFRAEIILLSFHNTWHAESCAMFRTPISITAGCNHQSFSHPNYE